MRRAYVVLSGLIVAGLVGSLSSVPRAATAAETPGHLLPQRESLDRDGSEIRGTPWIQRQNPRVPGPAAVWPVPGVARVDLPATERASGVRAGSLPVTLSRSAGPTGQPAPGVRVEVLARPAQSHAWHNALLLRVGADESDEPGAAQVSLDYSGLRYAYGGEWASRLRLWRLPDCALTNPDLPGCQASALPSTNVPATATVTGDLTFAAAPTGTLLALAAGESGSGGDFAATPFSASATWSAGGSGGDFSWVYPMRVPPGIEGPTPEISLSYSSSSVDGRSDVTNNQPSWIGEGFEFWPGFIERRYVPCAEDMTGGNNTVRTGDLCWRSDNATMNLNGRGSELIYEAGKGWHARSEDASRIEKLIGAANGDDNGEYWKVTTADAVQYFFGRHSLPGQSSPTASAWTVPVFGNQSGEPCHATAFTDSDCAQAWRWNLDYVVDPRGNTVSYWYAPEGNQYAQENTDAANAPYVRGGTLARIDYGTWDRGSADRSTLPVAQVVLDTGDRCLSACTNHDGAHWPDTPWDRDCALSATSCSGRYAPTFWSTRRLAKITTRVWDTTRTPAVWQDVDSWTLGHSFPALGDVHAGLWLDSISHSGHVGAPVAMPPVTFEPVTMANRVLTSTNTTNDWQRIGNIVTEAGAKIQVSYSVPECSQANLPSAPHTNTMRCYPVRTIDPYDPYGQALITEWWHKYVVTSVSESDLQLASGHQAPPKFTFYQYVGSPAWHYADDDGLTKPDRKTWSQFRGYATVKTRVGDVPGQQTLVETDYLRGMHGDRLSPSGGTRVVTVPASIGSETVYDEDQFAGTVREQIVYNGTESKPVSKTVNVAWMSPPTASRTINGDTVTARFVNTRVTYTATALGVDGVAGWRIAGARSTFSDTDGGVVWTQDDGDIAATGDEHCISYIYNRNTAKNLLRTVKQTTTTALACAAAPQNTDDVIDDVRTTYDGATSPDTPPVFGSATKIEQLKDWTAAGGTVWQTVSQATFDAFGRPATATDVRGNTSNTTYTPASGGPVTTMTLVSPAPYSWVTTFEVSPYWGTATRTTDANAGVVEAAYDALGRVAKVWRLGWDRAANPGMPSAEYTYTFSPNRADYPYIASRVLNAGGGYRTSYQIFDGLLRPRQNQTAAIGGGRVVVDTLYNRLGRVDTAYSAHLEPGTPGGVLWWEPEWSVPAVDRTVFDNAGRATASVFLAGDGVSNLVEKWRTATSYTGDMTLVTPPAGAIATTTVTDVRGRTIEQRQHTTAAGVGGAFTATWYTYNRKNQLVRLTDPAGNEWTYTFDLKGRQRETRDPDKGLTRSEYNDFDELIKTTDARGEVLVYTYDQIGRRSAVYDDTVSAATKRAEWKYDRLYSGSTVRARGQLTEAIRYEPAGSVNAYKWQARSFTARYQPGGSNYVIPAVEGAGLSGTHVYSYGYSQYDGSPTGIGYPAAGDLPAETVTTAYDATTGLPVVLQTNAVGVGTYVAGQQYTAYGEPTLTTRKTAGGVYVEDATYYDEATRRVTRTTIKAETASGTASDIAYGYDPAGNILSIGDTPQVGSADTQCLRHDALARLITAWTPKAGVACGSSPALANLGGPAPYWLEWSFDSTGSRRSEISHSAAGDTTRSYAVPTGGAGVVRPHALTSVTTAASGQPAVTTNYAYDGAGNMTCRPSGTATNTCPSGTGSQQLTWSAEGLLSTVASGGTTVETGIYSADGARWIRRDTTGTTLYLPGQELRRQGSTTTGTRYYTFGLEIRASRSATGLTWLYGDHQGTSQIAINAATQSVSVRRQTPYGGSRGTPPPWPNPKGFVNGDTDPTGLTHLGAREYDPGIGRFISVDPVQDLADPQQWNGYSYAGNSPVTRSDPTGLKPCDMGDDCTKLNTYTTKPANKGYTGAEEPAYVKNSYKGPSKLNIREWAELNDPHQMGWGCDVAGCYYSNELMASHNCYLTGCAKEIEDSRNAMRGLMEFGSNFPIIGIPFSLSLAAEDLAEGNFGSAALNLLGAIPSFKPFKWGGKAADEVADALSEANKLCSFSADTEVLMADGTTKPMSEIRVGDDVLATDPETDQTSGEDVSGVWVHPDTLMELVLGGQVVITTEDHPFWNETDQRWQQAQELDPGDLVRTPSGDGVRADGLRWATAHAGTAYNLTVTDIHTYYVVAGDVPVLVHNNNCITMSSTIGEDSFLTRAAEQAGRNQRVQQEMDNLFAQLSQGNMNPGIGTKALAGTDVFYARGSNGARLFFRNVDGGVQIVGKADKGNESAVINRLLELYGR